MELHDNLYALGLRLGREVFDDPDSLRGALDDYLDEDAATTGDINLLVDAVRLGAFRSMASMLDSGAEVSRAVEEAGGRLARDRGSADVAGSRWACAVLGFAIGKVGEADVRRYRTQAPPASTSNRPAPAAPTQLPASQPQPSYQPPMPSPQPQPSYQPSSQPQPGYQSPPGTYQPQQNPSLQPPWGAQSTRKRKLWPILVAALAVLVVAGGSITAVVLGGGDGKETPKNEKVDPSPTEDPLDFEAIDARYSGLGTAVTTGVDECADSGAGSGETEKLSCTFDDGTLTLVTYDSAEDLGRGRTRDVDLKIYGGMFLMVGGDFVYGFDASENEDDTISESTLYWDDDHNFQTAKLEAKDQDVTLDDLKRIYGSADSTLGYPTRPTDGQLVQFINRLSESGKCTRIATLTPGETEENKCKAPSGIELYYGKWQQKSFMNDYREKRAQNARESGGKPDTWNLIDNPDATIGNLDQYLLDSGADAKQAVIYWDDTECLCYGEAYLPGTDQTKLYNWWANQSS